jgi:hypothetical protein
VGRLKSLLKPAVPAFALDAYRELQLAQMRRRIRARSAEDVFTEIYANNLWGGDKGTYCSGPGSRDSWIVGPYVECMGRELRQLGGAITAVDLGCGDYAIGSQLAPSCDRYIGVDVVQDLVAHNNREFANDSISFRHLDIVEDELPDADVCFVRQVLQHLSNDQIGKLLPKLMKYSRCFVTEHHPPARLLTQPNLNKPHGADTRLNLGSGVFLEAAPFSIDPHRLHLILEVPGSAGPGGLDPGVIRTFVLRPPELITY